MADGPYCIAAVTVAFRASWVRVKADCRFCREDSFIISNKNLYICFVESVRNSVIFLRTKLPSFFPKFTPSHTSNP